MYRFQDETLTLEERCDALMRELAPEEKRGFLLYHNKGVPRLGIKPYSWWSEALHGLARSGQATCFPQAIALAATFTPDFVEAMGNIIALEARARHFESVRHGDCGTYKGLNFFSPNINIFRDPRWGRGHETYGECPFLTSEMGMAYVRGMQGDDPEHLKTVATPKHFAVHSGPEATRLGFDSRVSERDLNETYLPAFKNCLTKAGAQSVMTSYNAVNGTPSSMNSAMIRGLLREKWGFKGVVVTDAFTAQALWKFHKKASDYQEALGLELKNGVDLMTDLSDEVEEAYARGLFSDEDIDRAVRNQLMMKFRLGMFDGSPDVPPYELIECKAHRETAFEIARRGIVLLKNDSHLLPLNRERIGKIAVIGPNADEESILYGNYAGSATRRVTPLQGIINEFGDQDRVIYALGCEHIRNVSEGCADPDDRVAEAVIAAEMADVVVLCLGLSPRIEGEGGDDSNADAAGDKESLELPPVQLNLLKQIRAVGKPLVIVNISGSAIAVEAVAGEALVQCFYPGPEGGRALADILFGHFNPSGFLPVTFYRSTGDLPPFDDYSMENRTYRFFKGEVLYPFGYGLSYTTFEYSALKAPEKNGLNVPLSCSVTVSNTGNMDGETVIQLYFRHLNAPTRVPLKQLAAVKRISLEAGETQTVELTVPAEAFLMTFEDGTQKQVPGTVELLAGNVKSSVIRG